MYWRESCKMALSLHRIGDLSCANIANNSFSILILHLQVYRTSKIIHVIMQSSWVPIYYYLFCFAFCVLEIWKTDSFFFLNSVTSSWCMKWDALTLLWWVEVIQIYIYIYRYRCKTFILHIKLLWVIIVKSVGFHILGMWPNSQCDWPVQVIHKENSRLIKTLLSVPKW